MLLVFVLALFFSAFHYAPPVFFGAVAFFVWAAVRVGARRLNLANPVFIGLVLFVLALSAQTILYYGFAWFLDAEPSANPILFWPTSLTIAVLSGLIGPPRFGALAAPDGAAFRRGTSRGLYFAAINGFWRPKKECLRLNLLDRRTSNGYSYAPSFSFGA